MDDAKNALVLTVFAGSVAAVIVGYLVAWRSKRTVSRRVGSLMVASVAGFAGLVMSVWLMGAVMPLPPPDGGPLWEPLVFLLVFSPLPVGAFYLCAKFVREAHRAGQTEAMRNGIRSRQYLQVSATIVVSCLVCALAWWWHGSSTWWMNSTPSGIERLYPWLSTLTEVLNFPGWLVVMICDPRESQAQLATRLTDVLIPILSGLFWTLLAVLFVKLWRIFGGYVQKPAR